MTIYGIPRLAPVYNQLDNLLKVIGGGAYGFYLDSRRRFVTSLREGLSTATPGSGALPG